MRELRFARRIDRVCADGAKQAGGAAERGLARGIVLCDLVWDVSRPSGNIAALYHSRTYAHGAVSLDSCAHKRALPLVVSVNLIEVGEDLVGRAVDLDAVLDHGFDPLLVPGRPGSEVGPAGE